MRAKPRFWTCVCGATHEVTDEAIRCVGPGHSVYISPAYWTYEVGKKDVKQQNVDYDLFGLQTAQTNRK